MSFFMVHFSVILVVSMCCLAVNFKTNVATWPPMALLILYDQTPMDAPTVQVCLLRSTAQFPIPDLLGGFGKLCIGDLHGILCSHRHHIFS